MLSECVPWRPTKAALPRLVNVFRADQLRQPYHALVNVFRADQLMQPYHA